MRRRPFYQQAEWRILAALTLLAVVLTVWHHRAGNANRVSPPERAIAAVVGPLQSVFSRAWEETTLTFRWVGRARQLARQNERLKRQIAEKEARLTERQNDYLKYLRLLTELGFPEPLPPDTIPARVIGRGGARFLRQTIYIEATMGHDIRQGDVVRTEKGLVGRVISAQGNRGTATILLDPNSGVAAAVQPSGLVGSVLGPDLTSPDPDLLRLVRLDRNAAIAIGERVVTAAIGETYPKDIPIGVIEEVVGGTAPGESKTALVQPYVAFDQLDWVQIVRPAG
jgi:rod shape-determining protein MreC